MRLDRLALILACGLIGVFFVLPLGLMVVYSVFTYDPLELMIPGFTFENYFELLTNPYDRDIFWRTIRLSVLATIACLIIGFCVASYMRYASPRKRIIVTLVMMTPIVLSDVVLGYAWLVLLSPRTGTLSTFLQSLGLIEEVLPIMGTDWGVFVGLVYMGMGFSVVNIYAALESQGMQETRAAAVHGAGPLTRLLRITLPLTKPGLVSGAIITFAVTSSAFVLPLMLGGTNSKVLSVYIYDLNTRILNWPLGAAAAIALLVLSLITGWLLLVAGTSGHLKQLKKPKVKQPQPSDNLTTQELEQIRA